MAQLDHLEAECNAIISSMRLENLQCRQDFAKVQGARFSHHDVTTSKPKQNLLVGRKEPFHRPCTPKHDLQVHTKASAPITPQTVAEELCVTPSGFRVHLIPGGNILSMHRVSEKVRMDSVDVLAHSSRPSLTPTSVRISQQPALEQPTFDLPCETLDSNEEKLGKVCARWLQFSTQILLPKNRRHPWFKVMGERLRLWSFWTVLYPTTSRFSLLKVRTVSSSNSASVLRAGSIVQSESYCAQAFVFHPDHFVSMANLTVQSLLILIDVIAFPLVSFRTHDTLFDIIMMYVSAAYWTWNVVFSFMTGFPSPEGIIDMRPARIARQYVSNWFVRQSTIPPL